MNSNTLSQHQTTSLPLSSLQDQYKQAGKFFDDHLLSKSDLCSIAKLLIYLPCGILVLLLRLAILAIVKLLISFNSNFKKNGHFIKLCCFALGIQVKLHDKKNFDKRDDEMKIYICNHITCLDYYPLKNIVNNLNFYSENNVYPTGLIDLFSNLLVKILEPSIKRHDREDFYFNKANYPFVFFPEQMTTNGKYGLLKFDAKPFDLAFNGAKVVIQPVCLKVSRPCFPLSVNCSNSSDFLNILLALFSPVTVYEVELLNSQYKSENDTDSEKLAERIQNLIASNMKLVAAGLSQRDIKSIRESYARQLQLEQLRQLQQQQQQQQQQRSQQQSNINRSNSSRNNSLNFSDISRVALQIKEILPNVSFETIQHHVRLTSSLDIDSIIASILDSNDLDAEDSSENNNQLNRSLSSSLTEPKERPTQLHAQRSTPALSSASNKKLSAFRSFEERKFELLNEARQRYLAKHSK